MIALKGLPVVALVAALAACGAAGTSGSGGGAPDPGTPSTSTEGVTVYDQTYAFDPSANTPDASAQYEIVTPTGRHVYLDVVQWGFENRKPTADDILLVTHGHPDHMGMGIVEGFPGTTVVMKAESIKLPDVTVTGVASTHTAGSTPADADNMVYVIDSGGIRIAHFGDIGQSELTADQKAAIGTPDLAISQLENTYSGMDAGSTVGFDLIASLKPRIFIPTHIWGDKEMAKAAADAYPAPVQASKRSIHIDPSTLPSSTTVLFTGLNADLYAKDLGLAKAPW
jgi:L-ascorbate metabolism protein UlaG (beta-lactamase superfamily)